MIAPISIGNLQQEHGIDNAAEMYTPSADAAAAMEGTAPSLLDGMAERLGPLALLVRKPTMKAINLLKASAGNENAATQRIVMTGSPGEVCLPGFPLFFFLFFF